jgi:hypothetical protein
MNPNTSLLLAILAGLAPVASQPQAHAASPVTIFVATNGNDAWTGKQSEPVRGKNDGPVLTIEQALKLSRHQRESNPGTPVSIVIRKGEYFLNAPVVLKPTDSGLAVKQFRKEKAVVSGGRPIRGWREATVGGLRCWETQLPADALNDGSFRELWVNGKRAVRARHPNHGYLAIAALPDKTADWTKGQRRFEFKSGDIKAFPGLTNAEAIAMTRWVESRLPITGIDESAHIINFSKRSVFQLDPGDLYYLEGAPEFLDQAGEWCLSPGGLLRYAPLPRETPGDANVVAPRLAQVLRFEGAPDSGRVVEGVTFEGITFSHTEWCFPDGFASAANRPEIDPSPDPEVGGFAQAAIGVPAAVWGQGMRKCVFRNCEFVNLGTYALELGRGSSSNLVSHCTFASLGGGGIKIGETAIRSEPKLIASDNEVSDCTLENGGLMFHSAIGIWIGQSPGNRLLHNDIHDFYYTGISVGWTWGYATALASNTIVEFNRVHHIGVRSDGDGPILSDMAGIYTLGKQPGTLIRNNLWHDTAGLRYGGWGIYFDEGSSGILAENNIVYRTTHGGFHQHYGETNLVRNNIFAFARDYQLQRSRVEDHVSFSFQTNIVYFDSGVLFGSEWSGDKFRIDYNDYYDARTAGGAKAINLGPCSWKDWQERGNDLHSILADPGFTSVAKLDFSLTKDSPALKLGFRPIDTRQIGPRKP